MGLTLSWVSLDYLSTRHPISYTFRLAQKPVAPVIGCVYAFILSDLFLEIFVTRILCLLLCLLLAGSAWAQDQKIPEDKDPKTTESGLKYSVLHPGAKAPHPHMGQAVKVHYTGWLENGTVFDSSKKQGNPMVIQLGKVIPGWNEGLQLMTPGARFKFTIPSKLAYGPKANGPIPANSTLIFEVELIEIWPKPVFRKLDPAKTKTTASGLKYEILEPGTGEKVAKTDAFDLRFAFWNQKGRLLDWTGFQGAKIKGTIDHMGLAFLKEAPLLLSSGARFLFEVPPALCFKNEARGEALPANSTTTWELILERVIKPLEAPKFSLSAPDRLKTTKSGLQYEVIKEGAGVQPKMGSSVTVHYAGWLTDGTLFDSSFSRGEPITFALGNVIKGWNEGLQLMKQGAVYKFTIPSKLAYGEKGKGEKIGPNATLIFHVELIKVKP